MTPPRCAYNRHCNEETIGDGPDGQPYCFDHLGEVLSEAERERLTLDHWPDTRGNIAPMTREEHRSKHMDEHGRNPKVMKNARAM